MGYCDVEDVKARAGALKGTWDDTTSPSDGDIERFIRDAGAAIDASLAGEGFTAPATEPLVVGALLPVVADMALLMLISATWPGATGGRAVPALRAEVQNRVYGKDGKGGYNAALKDGTYPALAYLRDQNAGSSGASDFWTREAGYSSWLDDWQSGAVLRDATGSFYFRSPVGPGAHRDMKF